MANFGKTNFHVVVTGPGVVNTAHGLTVYLERHKVNNKTLYPQNHIDNYKPFVIIQTGIAGFFEGSGLTMGDVVIATSETYIHTGVRRVSAHNNSADNCPSFYPHDPLPFYLLANHPMSRQGRFEFDAVMVEKAYSIIEKRVQTEKNITERDQYRVSKGDFITVSAITATSEHANTLFKAFDSPCMEAMEGAASAHIAALYNIPFLEIRSASNPVGVRDKKRWDIPLACHRASLAIESLLATGDGLL